jgi:putative peptide zinc metalloprotease protein
VSTAASLPGLRQELRIERGPPQVTGAPSWTLFDPVRNMFFALGRIEFRILSRWANGSFDGLDADLESEGLTGEAARGAVARVVEFSLQNHLTTRPATDTVGSFAAARARAKKAWWRWLVDNYLFIRIPLVRPARFLERTLPRVRGLGAYPSLVFLFLLGITGMALVSRQWDAFVTSFLYFFSWQGLAAYAVGLVAVKIAHELGHAYVATRYGVRVSSMGVSFLVLFPVLYTDTTGAWRLTSRRQKLAIDCAGIATELAIASVATLLWVLLPEGPARSVAFILATTSWVMSLAINLNPFMRFDGYYVLADALGIANLQPRAFALGRWQLRELLFGLGEPPPEAVPTHLRRVMVAYAWMTWAYRLALFIGIALLVYHLFFKLLGIILFAVEMAVFVIRPILAEIGIWHERRVEIMAQPRARRLSWLAAGLLLLTLLPLDRHVNAPAVLQPIGVAPLVAGEPARVERVLVANGEHVAKGALLVLLSSPELQREIGERRVRIAILSGRIDRAAADAEDLSNRTVLERELLTETNALLGLQRRAARLRLVAPFAGVVADLGDDVHAGRWLDGSETLLRVLTPGRYDVRAYVAEADSWRIGNGADARFVPDDAVQASFRARVVEVARVAAERLDQPMLASTNGGDIAVREAPDRSLVPRAAVHAVRLVAERDGPGDRPVLQVTPGRVEIRASAESLAGRTIAGIVRILRGEASLASCGRSCG